MSLFSKLTRLFGKRSQDDSAHTARGQSSYTINAEKTISLDADKSSFLPIIRNFSADDAFHKLIVNDPMGEDIGAFLAVVNTTAEGMTRLNYVTKADMAAYAISEEEAFNYSLQNLKNAGLHIEGWKHPEADEEMISISSKIGLSTSILYEFDFIAKLRNDLRTDQLYVTIINSGTLFLSVPGGEFEKTFPEMAASDSYHEVVNINAATYLWEDGELKLVQRYR